MEANSNDDVTDCYAGHARGGAVGRYYRGLRVAGREGRDISESTGRAGMFLSAVSGGLVALGLIATAARVGSAFYAFGLALLPTLAVIGVMTFQRVVQSGIEDHGYARRISRLRAFYFDRVPQLTVYMPGFPRRRASRRAGSPAAARKVS
jgi:hypothetical protein